MTDITTSYVLYANFLHKTSKIKKVPPQGAGYGKSFARKPLVSIASLYFPPQGAGNYTQIIKFSLKIKGAKWLLLKNKDLLYPE